MSQKDRMIASKLYFSADRELVRMRERAARACFLLNQCDPTDHARRFDILDSLFGSHGKNLYVNSPFYCDYGCFLEVGDNFYTNYNCVILDCAPVKIGDNCMFGPNVSLYTAGHPLDAEQRASGWEYAVGITIGDNVWLGGNVVVNPGVTIGDGVVVGSGSIVTRDIPANSLAVGNPARVLRRITEEDRKYYFKHWPYEVGED